jgi:transcriptional regulator with XRE-family HTH domain
MSVIALRDTQGGVASGRGVAYEFWERINRLLYERGLSQKWLVETAHVSAMTINRLKTQTRPPKAETVHALADAMGIDRDEAGILAGRLTPPSVDAEVSVRDLVARSRRYTDEERTGLLAHIDALEAAHRARMGDRVDQRADHPPRSDSAERAI